MKIARPIDYQMPLEVEDVSALMRTPEGHRLSLRLKPGLYRFTVNANASKFEWEDLYLDLHLFENKGERTGPWDFNILDQNRPILPAYWVFLDGERLGLWYFNRPGYREINSARLVGETGFWIKEEGLHEFRFEPYRKFHLEWTQHELAPEPEDSLLEKVTLKREGDKAFQRLFHEDRWSVLRQRLTDTEFCYRELFLASCEWAMRPFREKDGMLLVQGATGGVDSSRLPILGAMHRLGLDEMAMEGAKSVIRLLLDQPNWGNPNDDGYGHNGDMQAAMNVCDLALALNILDREIEGPLRDEIIARLECQAERFLTMALLHRGYWGGSVLQDHGFCSFSYFTTGIYLLVGWTERANEWLRFCLPRLERTMQAVPTDGVIPASSYHLLGLYADKMVLLRELHRNATGVDIYENPAFQKVPKFAYDTYLPEKGSFLFPSVRGDILSFYGGHAFLDQMAREFDNPYAVSLVEAYLRLDLPDRFQQRPKEHGRFAMTLWASLLWEPTRVVPAKRDRVTFQVFDDTGTVLFRDEDHGNVVVARCGPANGHSSLLASCCPCDHSVLAPVSGTFAMSKNGMPYIVNAEGGYKVRSALGNVVLIDGKGQIDDHAPPMNVTAKRYSGEKIEEAGVDPETGVARVLMNLLPAYEGELGLIRYVREFLFGPDGSLRLRDTISSTIAHNYTWLFHFYGHLKIRERAPNEFSVQQSDEMDFGIVSACGPQLRSKIERTQVVWGYVRESGNAEFQHICFETKRPIFHVGVEFVIA